MRITANKNISQNENANEKCNFPIDLFSFDPFFRWNSRFFSLLVCFSFSAFSFRMLVVQGAFEIYFDWIIFIFSIEHLLLFIFGASVWRYKIIWVCCVFWFLPLFPSKSISENRMRQKKSRNRYTLKTINSRFDRCFFVFSSVFLDCIKLKAWNWLRQIFVRNRFHLLIYPFAIFSIFFIRYYRLLLKLAKSCVCATL